MIREVTDQASSLRLLVEQERDALRRPETAPRLLAVSSGKGGVGATTIAVNLAHQLALAGAPTVLVDLDLESADATALCDAEPAATLVDVLSGAKNCEQALTRLPTGLQLLAGLWGTSGLYEISAADVSRLIGQLWKLHDCADFIVVDLGTDDRRLIRSVWQSADQVLLVLTPEQTAVMNAYAAVKLHGTPARGEVGCLINRTRGADEAHDVVRRLDVCARRFLKCGLTLAGWLPDDAQVVEAGRQRRVLAQHCPQSPVVQALEQLSRGISAGRTAAAAGTWPELAVTGATT